MKSIIIFISALFLSLAVHAQQDEIPDYVQFEKLLKKINELQRFSDGKRFTNIYANSDLNLYLSETNSFFNYHNLSFSGVLGSSPLAEKSATKREIIENIDLSGVNDLVLIDDQFGDLRLALLQLPKTMLYKTIVGNEVSNVDLEVVPFFSVPGKENEMANVLSEFVYLIKIKKGLISAKEATRLQNRWKATTQKNTAEAYYDYYRNEPNNLLTRTAYYKLSKLDRTLELDDVKSGNFYLGMTKTHLNNEFYKRFNTYPTEDQILKTVKQNYFFYYNQYEDYYLTATAIWVDNSGLNDSQFTRKETEIKQMEAHIEKSEGNDLQGFFPANTRLRLDNPIFNSSNKLCLLSFEFYIKNRQSLIEVARKVHDKYGVGPFKYSIENNQFNFICKGIGDRVLGIRAKDVNGDGIKGKIILVDNTLAPAKWQW